MKCDAVSSAELGNIFFKNLIFLYCTWCPSLQFFKCSTLSFWMGNGHWGEQWGTRVHSHKGWIPQSHFIKLSFLSVRVFDSWVGDERGTVEASLCTAQTLMHRITINWHFSIADLAFFHSSSHQARAAGRSRDQPACSWNGWKEQAKDDIPGCTDCPTDTSITAGLCCHPH